MITSAQAFLLLTLPDVNLVTPMVNQSGTLALECVSVASSEYNPPDGQPNSSNRDVYLVLRLNNNEFPIDPARVIEISVDAQGVRTYKFHGTPSDPLAFILKITPPTKNSEAFVEDLETFEGIIAQYADLRGSYPSQTSDTTHSNPPDYRGHLVLVNEDTGEIVGEIEHRFRVHEDPSLSEKGRENEPVVIEVPQDVEKDLDNGAPIEVFARYIPPGEENWITKGAVRVRLVLCFFSIIHYGERFFLVTQFPPLPIYF
jgi:spartin